MATFKPFANLGLLLKLENTDDDDFHRSATEGDEEKLLKCLDTRMEDVDSEDDNGNTALFRATENGHTNIIEILLKHGAIVNSKKNPLHVLKNLRSAQLLVAAEGDINCRDSMGQSPLQRAVLTSNMEIVNFLLESESDINIANTNGETVLHMACRNIHIPDSEVRLHLVQKLIKKGININKRDSKGKSALHVTCSDGASKNLELIRNLIDGGASVFDRDYEGLCPIHYFVEETASQSDEANDLSTNAIDILIAKQGLTDIRNAVGHTVLHLAASGTNGHIISHLIQKGCSVNAVDGRGRVPLHYITKHGQRSDALRILVEEGSDIDARDAWGQTVLQLAIGNKNTELIASILKYGADVNLGDLVGRRPLHVAAESGSREACSLLFNHGADLDSLDLWSATPLHLAAWGDQPGTARFLLEAGCDVSREDSRGHNPVSVAQFRSSANFLREVLKDDSASSQVETKSFSKYGNELLQLDRLTTIIDSCDDTQLRSEPHVEEFLSSVLSAPTVGRAFDDPEALEIHHAVEQMVQNLVKMISKEDPKLRCTLVHAGSCSEGTKTRFPDEFDFMACLEEISDCIYPEHEQADCVKGATLTSAARSIGTEVILNERLEENVSSISDYTLIHLNEETKYCFDEFTESGSRFIPCPLMFLRFTEIISRTLRNDSFPKDARLIIQEVVIGPVITLQWRGCRYKTLNIEIDFVPAVRLPSWPEKSRKNTVLLNEDVRCLPCLAVPKLPGSPTECFDIWRCSMSLQETTIMRKCHPHIRNSYLLAKALVSSAICPLVSFENYEDIKTIYRSRHGSVSSNDDEFEVYERAEDIIPSYILKMAFLFAIEDKAERGGINAIFDLTLASKERRQSIGCNTAVAIESDLKQYGCASILNIPSDSDSIDSQIVVDIFQRCAEWLSDEFVPSFFNPRHNVLGSSMLDGGAAKALYFVKYIQRLLV